MSRSLCVYLFICECIWVVTSILPLIGPNWECYIVEEVIEVDKLNEGNISTAAEKQNESWKAELSCATLYFD